MQMQLDESLIEVENIFFKPNNLSLNQVSDLVENMHRNKIDYGDMYFQNLTSESYSLENGIVKSGSFSSNCGVGIRAVTDYQTSFVYSDELSFDSISKATQIAINDKFEGRLPNSITHNNLTAVKKHHLYTNLNPLTSIDDVKKIWLLKEIDKYCRSKDSNVINVIASLNASYSQILVLATDGTHGADIRPLVRLNVTVIVSKNNKNEVGFAGGGGRYLLDEFLQKDLYKTYCDDALHQANLQFEAKPAPSGSLPVVLGAGWPGVLIHEAVGHGLEADFIRKGSSIYTNKIGQKVASEACTIIDDGTLANRRGSLNIDDEGVTTQRNVLIENGILKSYMSDKVNAMYLGIPSSGNGRRESYAHLPMPRMTNTYMLGGDATLDDIIKTIKKGIYAKNFSGGQVDISSGKFTFSTSEAYMVENGKITYPIKDATLIGDGPEILQRISMVANDMKLDSGVGTCGKDGQTVPVGVGQPSLKIDEMTIGGTS